MHDFQLKKNKRIEFNIFRINENDVVVLDLINDDEMIVDIHHQNPQEIKNNEKLKVIMNMMI